VLKSKPNTQPTSALPARRTSLRDLAEHLNLSRATISLVLNNSPVAQNLTAETRARVLKAAKEFNYKPNYFARALSQKRSHLVGVLVPDLNAGYNSELLTSMESVFIKRNYLYFISSHHWNEDLIRQRLEVFAERGAEGVVLINTPLEAAIALPVVSVGSLQKNAGSSRIALDNEAGVRIALQHLHGLGHRRIALFRGHSGSSDAEARWKAFKAVSRELGLVVDPLLVTQLARLHAGLDAIREGRSAMARLLKSGTPFTALLAFNDLSAIGAMQVLDEAGLRVPGDVSVVGFDDVSEAAIVRPGLTTVRQPLRQMGALAVKEILALIEDPAHAAASHSIAPELVVRASTATPKQP